MPGRGPARLRRLNRWPRRFSIRRGVLARWLSPSTGWVPRRPTGTDWPTTSRTIVWSPLTPSASWALGAAVRWPGRDSHVPGGPSSHGIPARRTADIATVTPFLIFAAGIAFGADWVTWH